MKKNEIIQYLKDNPGWVLQYQHGIRGKGWWWLRDNRIGKKSNTISLDARSAIAAMKELKMDSAGVLVFGETNYIL